MDKLVFPALAALAGGLIANKLRIPAGALIGAMIAVGAYNLLRTEANIPAELRVGIQIAAGALIGSRITSGALAGMKGLVLPALIMIGAVLATNFAIGFILYKTGRIDLSTALFASAPGGLTEMTLAADAVGADAPKVAALQLVRLICVLSFLPFLQRVVVGLMDKR